MSLSKAIQSFCHDLFEPHCEHSNVHSHGEHCPDCGDRIQLVWTQVRCRDCGARRRPKEKVSGAVGAVNPYCRFCGSHQIRLHKKHHIERHELPYSVLAREVDYQETSTGSVFRSKSAKSNPFASQTVSSPQGSAYAKGYSKQWSGQKSSGQYQSAAHQKSDESLRVGLHQFMNEQRDEEQAQSTFRSVMDVDLTTRPNPFKNIIDGDVLSSEYLS
jgi:DNA-directed RNA polymerase subunit RPC12/RpoP